MPFNLGSRLQVRFAYHRAVLGLTGLNLRKFLLFLMWTRPNLEPYKTSFFLCSMKAHLIPSVSHGDRSWGHAWWGWRCCWRWGWWRQSRVCLFLSRRLGPSVPLRRRLQIVRVVWRSCLLLICCIAFSWFLLDIKKSEFWSGFQLCLPYKLLRCKTFLLPFELFLSYPRHPLTAWFEIKYIRQFIPAPLMA